ncbi:MAG: hypothetical protein ACRBN8_18890 [Nannocystales bacterium]
MKPENPDATLLERGLAAWDVPEPPSDLADRILAQSTDAQASLSAQPDPAVPPPPEEETPTMLPTTIRHESSMRPFWTATALGFAGAAAIVLAFMAGRQSQPVPAPQVVSPALVPSVEVQVSAPPAVTQPPVIPLPPAPPTPPAPAAVPEKLIIHETRTPDEQPPNRSHDLKSPFGADASRSNPSEATEPNLKDPFADR